MRTVVLGETPPPLVDWLERRRVLGQDRHDEVWEGDYHVAPAPHRRHGDVAAQLGEQLGRLARRRGLWPAGESNIGSPDNYRVPDLTFFYDRTMDVFLPSAAIVVEVVSPGDESYAKFDFYFSAGVEEFLIVDPERRLVAWHRRGAEAFERAGKSALLDLGDGELAALIDWPD